MYKRLLSRLIRQDSKNVLLLGPRQVGKSTLLDALEPDVEVMPLTDFLGKLPA